MGNYIFTPVLSIVHHQQPGLASHQLENQQTQRSNNLLTFCPLRIASMWIFLVMFYEDRSFSPLFIIHLFISGLRTCLDGKSNNDYQPNC